jgi:hypothetical protein
VSGGFTFRAFEWQAVAVARVLSGRGNLPSVADQQKWEVERAVSKGDGVPFYKIGPEFEEYFTTLANIAGSPQVGTPGRVLPDWNPRWLETFVEGFQKKINLWKKEADRLESANENRWTVKAKL